MDFVVIFDGPPRGSILRSMRILYKMVDSSKTINIIEQPTNLSPAGIMAARLRNSTKKRVFLMKKKINESPQLNLYPLHLPPLDTANQHHRCDRQLRPLQ